MNEGKFCSKCEEYKSLNDYHKDKNKPMGVGSACKQCMKSIKQKHYINNKEKYKQAFQEFMGRNPNYREKYKKEIIT